MSGKRRLLIVGSLVVFLLASGISIALAYTGHFKSLANILNIGVDVTGAGSITVTVQDYGDNLKPVANLNLNLINSANRAVAGRATTNSSGQAAFLNVPFGSYSISVVECSSNLFCGETPGFEHRINSTFAGMLVQKGAIVPNGQLKVVVFDSVKKAASGGQLPIMGASVSINTSPVTTGSTDAQGSFLTGATVMPGERTVTVSKSGYQTQSAKVLVESSKADTVTIMLASETQAKAGNLCVVGKVLDNNANPLPEVNLSLTSSASSEIKATVTSNSNLITPQGYNQEVNYTLCNAYTTADGKPPGLKLNFGKDGYYYDANNNSKNDDNNVTSTDVKPGDFTYNAGLTSYIAYKNFTLRNQSENMKLWGYVYADEDRTKPLLANLKILEMNKSEQSKPVVVQDFFNPKTGYYEFNNLVSKVQGGNKYQIIVMPKDSNRSTYFGTIEFGKTSTQIQQDFYLALNADRLVVLEGNVYTFSANGTKTPAPRASLQLESSTTGLLGIKRWSAIGMYNADQNGHYAISLNDINLPSSDGSTRTPQNFRLIAFDRNDIFNKSTSPPQSEAFAFQILPYQGSRINHDFNFKNSGVLGNVDLSNTKDVTVQVQFQVRRLKNVDGDPNSSANYEVVSTQMAQGISVQLKSKDQIQEGQSGVSIQSATKTTNASGLAGFPGFPKKEALIEISGFGSQYAPDNTSLQLTAGQTRQVVILYTWEWNPSILVQALTNMTYHQGDYANTVNNGFSISSAGCCISSLAMTLKFYQPDKDLNPGYLADITRNNGLDALMSSTDNFQAIINAIQRDGRIGNDKNLAVEGLDTSPASIQKYLNLGIPVIVHATGGMKGHGGEHCIVLLRYNDGRYLINDPNPKDGSANLHYTWDDLGSLNHAYAVTSKLARLTLQNSRAQNISIISPYNFLTRAYAESTDTVTDASNVKLSAQASSNTIAPVVATYLKYNFGNSGAGETLLALNPSGNNYEATIVSYNLKGDIYYRVISIDALGFRFSSPQYTVKLNKTPATPVKAIVQSTKKLTDGVAKLFSQKIPLYVSAIKWQITLLLSDFRTAYNNMIAALGISQNNLYTVSGIVSAPSSYVTVKLADNITITTPDNPTYRLEKVPAGIYNFEVFDAKTGVQYVVYKVLTVKLSGSNRNLTYNIQAYDKSATGSISGYVYQGANIVKSGRIQLVSGPDIIREWDVSKSAGYYSFDGLPAGNYTFRYYSTLGLSKKIISGGSAAVVMQKITNNDIKF